MQARLRRALRLVPTRLDALPARSVLASTSDRLLDHFGSFTTIVSAGDASKSCATVMTAWHNERTLASCDRRTLCEAPWAFFSEPARRADDETFADAFVMAAQESSRLTRNTAGAFLNGYPDQWRTFGHWAAGIDHLLRAASSVSVRAWARRAASVRMFEAAGPTTCAEVWLRSHPTLETFLQDLGMLGALSEARFLRRVAEAALRALSQALHDGTTDGSWLSERLSLTITADHRIRFGLTAELARALLEPFSSRMPTKKISDEIVEKLRATIGDPRVRPQRWQGLEKFEPVARRLFAGQSMELFFELLAETADRTDMWAERRRFWMDYFRAGRINDAWVALGPDAVSLARKRMPELDKGFARYLGSYDRSHSVLVMAIGNAIVIEGSHNMMVRFWNVSEPGAPKLGAASYERSRITTQYAGQEQIAHQGDWQSKVRQTLRRFE